MFEFLRNWRGVGKKTRKNRRVFVGAVTHGTVSGWLAPFHIERNYIVNNHADHLIHLSRSPLYTLSASEVPNFMAMKQLRPDVFELLKQKIEEGRVELTNGFFLESAVNLVQGETLMRMGIEGIRWQEKIFGKTPKYAWMIDVVGVHAQIPEIVDHLGLDALVYSRNCPDDTIHWWNTSSGKHVLAISLGRECYTNWRLLFSETKDFEKVHINHLHKSLALHLEHSPENLPVLWLIANGDYSAAPLRADRVENFLVRWNEYHPDIELIFDQTPSSYFRELERSLKGNDLSEVTGDNLFSYNAFWVNNPRMKQGFKAAENLILRGEAAAALADVAGGQEYPGTILRDAWYLLFLNADRGLLWGIGQGEAFYGVNSWNAEDRFHTIHTLVNKIENSENATSASSFFNLNALTPAPFSRLVLPKGMRPVGKLHDAWDATEVLLDDAPAGIGFFNVPLELGEIGKGDEVELPAEIVTANYSAKICTSTGDLVSLILPDRRPVSVISAHANYVRFESQSNVSLKEDFLAPREERETRNLVVQPPQSIRCLRDDVSTVIETVSTLSEGGRIRRRLRFFERSAVIDADIEMIDVPDNLLVSLNFPLSVGITSEARGVSFGFSERDPRSPSLPSEVFLMADHAEHGINSKTVPAMGWSWHGNTTGVGLAILDRGVPGRESHGHTASLLLMNTSSGFRGKENKWLSGEGRNYFRYSLIPTKAGWRDACVPAHADTLNHPMCPSSCKPTGALVQASENLSVQSIRRDGRILELRCVERFGRAAPAWIKLAIPHIAASKGAARESGVALTCITEEDGIKKYSFDLKPQEIVTLRFDVERHITDVPILTEWDHLVPEKKRPNLGFYDPDLLGHPPE